FGGDAGPRIELADQAEIVAGEPDVAIGIFGQAMRAGVRRLERVFADRAGLRIDAAELVGELAGPPDRTIFCRARIVWARALGRHIPQIDACLHRTAQDHRSRALPLGEILHEIFGHRRPFLGWYRRIEVLHHAHDREPALRGVADAHPIDVMAGAARVGEALLHRAVRPFLRGILRLRWGHLRKKREHAQRATDWPPDDHRDRHRSSPLGAFFAPELLVDDSLAQNDAKRHYAQS